MTRKSNSIWHPQWMYPCSEIIPGCLPTLNHQREDKCDIQTCLTNSHLILVCIQVENSECHKPGSGNASYQRSDVREGPKCIQMSVLWAELFGFHLRFRIFRQPVLSGRHTLQRPWELPLKRSHWHAGKIGVTTTDYAERPATLNNQEIKGWGWASPTSRVGLFPSILDIAYRYTRWVFIV